MRILCGVIIACGILLIGALIGDSADAQSDVELDELNGQVRALYQAGKYADAIPIAERYVRVAQRKYGDRDPTFAEAITYLGFVYQAQGRSGEAERLFKRSLAIYETARGPDHRDVGAALNNLAELYQEQRRNA